MNEKDESRPKRPEVWWVSAQWKLAGLILSLGLAFVAYRVLHVHRLEQTAALFVGLPLILAVALALTPRAQSATGMIMKGMTIALLLSGPLLSEGFMCVLISSPLFYLVGLFVGRLIDRSRREHPHGNSTIYSFILIPLLLASLEGVIPGLSFPTTISVEATRVISASPEAIEAKLGSRPDFSATLPLLIRYKFPMPTGAIGEGLQVGDQRRMIYARPSGNQELVFVVAERSPGYVRFHAISDSTKIATWLTWRDAEVRWQPTADGRTRVEWTLKVDRLLSPGWYFAPIETLGVSQTAEYLIDALATP